MLDLSTDDVLVRLINWQQALQIRGHLKEQEQKIYSVIPLTYIVEIESSGGTTTISLLVEIHCGDGTTIFLFPLHMLIQICIQSSILK